MPILFDASLLAQSFGYYALLSAQVQRQIREKTYGTALMQINIRDLRKLLIPTPPLDQQEDIARRLEAVHQEVSRLRELYRRKLDLLQRFRHALLQHAFSGELTSLSPRPSLEAAE